MWRPVETSPRGRSTQPHSPAPALCRRYEYFTGTDQTYSVGGGNAGYTMRRSSRGFQILPLINQVNLVARVAPYFCECAGNRGACAVGLAAGVSVTPRTHPTRRSRPHAHVSRCAVPTAPYPYGENQTFFTQGSVYE